VFGKEHDARLVFGGVVVTKKPRVLSVLK
jgi:hypothetical protein